MQKLLERKPGLNGYWQPWLALFAGLALTIYASYEVKTEVEYEAQREFSVVCDETISKIKDRLQAHKLVLSGGAALFDASDSVERDEWHAFAGHMQVDQHLKGIQELGFSLLIPEDKMAGHLAEIRQQGFPEYTVRPAGERDVYSSIVYVEPFKDLNLRAFGYDMYSEPVRRVAMAQARDENVAALTAKVVRVPETSEDVQPSTLMFVPVYRKRTPIDTAEQRRTALFGWVFSSFHMDDLLQGVLPNRKSPEDNRILLKVYDGGSAKAANLLYDSDAKETNAAFAPKIFQLERHTDFNGRVWTLDFELAEGSAAGLDNSKVWSTFAAGLVISLLLFFLTSAYRNTRRHAQHIADELTANLRKAEAVFHALFEQSSFLAGIVDRQGRLVEVNSTALGFIHLTHEEVIGKYLPDIPLWSNEQDRGKLIEMLNLAHAGSPASLETSHPTPSGGHVNLLLSLMPIFLENSNWVSVVGMDITQRKLAEEALRESENRFHTMSDEVPAIIWLAGTDKLAIWFNKKSMDFTGRDLTKAVGNGWTDSIHPEDLQQSMDAYMKAFDARQEFNADFRLRRFDGEYHWFTVHGVPRYDSQGTFLGYIGSDIDITDRHLLEEQVHQLAFYDPLTKLPNRRLLIDRLSQAMAAGKRSGRHGALLFLDLDNFKPLNDTHGHVAGDLLLIEVANRLKSGMREIDTVARMGGDEFVVILSELEADKTESRLHARTVAEKIRTMLAEPYQLTLKNDEETQSTVVHHCTASIGVVVFINHEGSQDDLLKWADATMYQAKDGGRNQVRFHDEAGS